MNFALSQDVKYLLLFSLVLIFPKITLRFGIPSGITAIIIGITAGTLDPSIGSDQLFRFLSQIGITSLFLFAGLEVNMKELKADKSYLSVYLVKTCALIGTIAFGFSYLLGFSFQESFILSLGIVTPSAGFIINSLNSLKLETSQEYWIKSKAISKEIVAIVLLFVAMQADSMQKLIVSSLYLTILLIALPFLFRFFFRFISPHAPNSEVPLLVALSLISGVLSKEIGAYYLLGAFAVGLVGSRFKREIFKKDEETLFDAISNFFMVFLPFYFFYAGSKVKIEAITFEVVLIALAFMICFVPLRIWLIQSSLNKLKKNDGPINYDISISLMPTLIFGLVISGILIERDILPVKYCYGLLLYTLLTSVVPTIMKQFKKNNEVKLT